MGTLLSSLGSALRHPLTWAMALIFTASEASSLYPSMAGAAELGASIDTAAQLVTALVCGAAFVLARPLRRVLQRPASCLALGLCGVVPFLVGGADGAFAGAGLLWLSLGLSQVSAMGLTLVILLRLAACSSLLARSMVVASAALNAALVAALDAVPESVALVCVVAGSAALAAACGADAGASAPSPQPRCRRVLRAPLVLIAGFFVVASSFSFLQSLLYQQSQEVVTLVVVGTKLGAATLFALVLLWQNDTSYAMLCKLVITLATGGFLVFLAQGSYSPLASVFMATGYSLLEMTTVLLLADLASYASWQPLRLFAAFYLVETLGYATGCLLLEGGLALELSFLRVEAAGLALLLLVCAVWVFNENRVNAFTWGMRGEAEEPREHGAGEDPDASDDVEAPGRGGAVEPGAARPLPLGFAERTALVSERYRLTERETEVLELFAAGRSAAFIAELKFVTANTVRSHIKHIYAKCDVHSRQELISLIEAVGE